VKPLKIAIFCPIGYVTGGPEALHQLCDALRHFGQDANLVPTVVYGEAAEEYRIYDAPVSNLEFALNADVVITPENHLTFDWRFQNIESKNVYIWWLSVDNSPHAIANNYENRNHPINLLKMVTLRDIFSLKRDSLRNHLHNSRTRRKTEIGTKSDHNVLIDLHSVSHIAQSFYAQDFLKREIGQGALVVSDFIRRENEKSLSLTNPNDKKIIAYNYAKSHLLLSRIRRRMSRAIEFVPLVNMNSSELRNQLMRSDLYLDLGHFPGRDRLPREAISLGCPVLLAKRGAARFYDDFNLDDEFRFDIVNGKLKDLEATLKKLLTNKSDLFEKQRKFASSVSNDKQNFDREVQQFIELLLAKIGRGS
jgi:hypothetical protein